jgi:hypothetical protein
MSVPTAGTSSSSLQNWLRSPSGSAYPCTQATASAFAVVEGGGASNDAPARCQPWPPAWIDATTNDEHLFERARAVIRAQLGGR